MEIITNKIDTSLKGYIKSILSDSGFVLVKDGVSLYKNPTTYQGGYSASWQYVSGNSCRFYLSAYGASGVAASSYCGFNYEIPAKFVGKQMRVRGEVFCPAVYLDSHNDSGNRNANGGIPGWSRTLTGYGSKSASGSNIIATIDSIVTLSNTWGIGLGSVGMNSDHGGYQSVNLDARDMIVKQLWLEKV